MVCYIWGDQLNLVTLNLTLLLLVAYVDVDAIKPGSQVRVRLQPVALPSRWGGGRHADTFTRFSFQQASTAAPSGALDNANPWSVDATLVAFMNRFNIPKVHASGIKVDLGSEQEGYRQVSGLCPVFGKVIRTYQPAGYSNNFLDNAPTTAPVEKPIRGGFNNPQQYAGGRPLSPVEDSWIQEKLGSASPKTDIGRCAKYAYSTVSVNPKTGTTSLYKYPFVMDRQQKLCYVLAISAQELSGAKYCSTNGSPAGLTWYCFEPKREVSYAERFVYGSALIGITNGDEWATKCPVEAVRGAMFGSWRDGNCVAYDQESSVQSTQVSKKEDCWKLVFENSRVASDQAAIPQTPQTEWQDFWPGHTLAAPKSRGNGVNWANYYTDAAGVSVCSLFGSIPDCFVDREGAVAYTALGQLTEADLPECDSVLEAGECVNCQHLVYKCQHNNIVKAMENCCEQGIPSTGNDQEESEGIPALAIAGGVLGGLLLLGALGAGVGYYMRSPTPAPTEPQGQPAVGGKEAHRASDVAATTDMSVWGESAEVDGILPREPVETNY